MDIGREEDIPSQTKLKFISQNDLTQNQIRLQNMNGLYGR